MFKWLFHRHRSTVQPRLSRIYIATSAGKPMQAVSTINVLMGKGLEGDRYYRQTGFWKSIEACQVTLITEHDIRRAQQKDANWRSQLLNGAHRRNLVIDGLTTKSLEGMQFRIGSAVFSYQKPRPPCGYLDKVAGTGISRILANNSGICIRVEESGIMTVGDAVVVLGTN